MDLIFDDPNSNWAHFCLVTIHNPMVMFLYFCGIGLVCVYVSLLIGTWWGYITGDHNEKAERKASSETVLPDGS
jgi:hypothetical protein